MLSNRLGLALVGAACIVAAGAGGFLATRQAVRPFASAPAPVTPVSVPTPAAVQETEATVGDEPAPAASAPAAVNEQPAASSVRSEPAAAPPKATRSEPTAQTARADKPKAPVHRPPVPVTPPAGRTPESQVALDPSPRSPEPVTVPRAEPPAGDPVAQSSATSESTRRVESPEPQEQRRQFQDLVVPADSVIGLQLESTVSSETARVEDRVDARVTRDVSVDGRVAIPAGARLRGTVTLVDRGGKMRDRSRLGVRFHTLVLADGTTMGIQTDTVYREGDSPASASAAKIGGAAIGGAILGAIMGGARGAVIGGTTGAAGGTATVMAGGRKAATLAAGSPVTVRVLAPVTVTVEN